MALIDWPDLEDAVWAQFALDDASFALARLFGVGGVLWNGQRHTLHGGAGLQPAPAAFEVFAHVVDIAGNDLAGTDALALAPVADWHIYLEEWPEGATEAQLIVAGDILTSAAQPALKFRVVTVRPSGGYLDGDLEVYR